MPLLRYLRLIARLKGVLMLRYLQRNPAGGATALIAVALISLVLVAVFAVVALTVHTSAEPQRDTFVAWTFWLGTLWWLFAPLAQFDAQRNLDLTSLRLLPLSRLRFTLAVLLDGALSPLGWLTCLGALGCCVAYVFNLRELLLMLLALPLLGLFQLGCAQTLYLLGNRVFSSRRFGEVSMALGLIVFMGLQLLNLLFQSGVDSLPPWLQSGLLTLRALLEPLGRWLAPGVAAQAFSAGAQGWLLAAARNYALLVLQAGAALLLAAWAARMFYEGELESGGSAQRKPTPRSAGRRRFAGHWHGITFPPLLAALLERERAYLWRDPLVKMQLLQSLFGSIYIAAVALMLRLQQNADFSHAWLDRGGRYILLGVALMLGLSESAILFNKFGYEGGQLTNLLVTPASRRILLASKSLHLVGHFLPLNLMLALMAGLALHAPPLFIALALLLVVTSTLLLDLVGHYVSIYYPFSYRRVGRRLRAVMPQPGCGYALVYMLVFQLCHLLTLPSAALSIALTLLLGWPGFGLALACSAGAAWAAYRYGLSDVAARLAQREPQLLGMLSKAGD